MITLVSCLAILGSLVVIGRSLDAPWSTEPDRRWWEPDPYKGTAAGFALFYCVRLVQDVLGEPTLYIPTYRVLVLLGCWSIGNLTVALQTAAYNPFATSLSEWWNAEEREPRGLLYAALGALMLAGSLLIFAPAYIVDGHLPVLHAWNVQATVCVISLPIIVRLWRLSVEVSRQLALAPATRMRMRYVSYCAMAWVANRLIFDVALTLTWPRWTEVGLVVDAVLFGSTAFLLFAGTQRRIEEAMDRFGAEYVMGSMAEAMVAVDPEGLIRVVNHSAAQLIGRPRDTLLGQPAADVLDAHQWTLGDPQRLRHTPRQHEVVRSYLSPTGELRYVESRTVALLDGLDCPAGRVEILHDITEYKDAQERLAEYSQMLEDRIADRSRALAESEERHRGLVDNLADCLLIVRDDAVRFANPAAKALWQKTTAMLHGTPVAQLWDADAEAPWSELRAQLEANPNVPWRGEMHWRVTPEDAREFLVTASTARWEGHPAILLVGRDNTERAKLQSSLDRVRRLQALGTLTGGIAHDFNNYLTSILGRLSMIEQTEEEGSVGHKNVQRALEAADKARQLVTRLLRFSRPGESGRAPTDLCALLHDTEPLLKSLVSEEIRLEWHVPTEPLWAVIDPASIQEILLNLAKNANDAMQDEQGVLLVTARTELRVDGGNNVLIIVTDTGPGLTKEAREHLFEPFFTTKPVGKGHGLGLALAHQIMQEHDGTIEAESEPGSGTTFKLTVPACPAPTEALPVAPDIALVEGQGEVVLVVDDDRDVLQTTSDMLMRLGYSVLTAGNGQMALEVMEMESDVAAVVMDIVMPEMNGVECAKRLLERGYTTPIIFITGYDPDPERLQQLGTEGIVLKKPFRFRELANIISKEIAAARAAA